VPVEQSRTERTRQVVSDLQPLGDRESLVAGILKFDRELSASFAGLG